jgi:hypothetical protein
MFVGHTDFPSNNQLNPYTDNSDSTNLISGNPELKPSTSKSYVFEYYLHGTDYALRITSGYSKNKNLVSTIITPLSQFVTRTTYANVASSENISFNIFLTEYFFNFWELSPTFTAIKSKYAGIGVQNDGTSWFSILYSMLSFGNFKFETIFNYHSGSYTAQQKTNPTWSMDAGTKLLLLHKTLSLTLRASDIFNTSNSNSNIYGTGIFVSNNVRQKTRIFSLSLSYYFRMEAQEKIEEDKPYDVLPTEF